MKLFNSTWLAATVLLCGWATTVSGQGNDDRGGYSYTGSLVRDLAFGPEWRSYQALSQPTRGELSRTSTKSPSASIAHAAPLQPATPAPLPKQTDYALKFFGGESARQTLEQMPPRPSFTSETRSASAAAPRGHKPFQHASRGPTISPYLNLDRPETSEELPNYFAFVRPQVEQNEINRRQQRELLKLERQVQTAAYGTAAATAGSTTPTTGHGTRFGDTGRYYGGWRR